MAFALWQKVGWPCNWRLCWIITSGNFVQICYIALRQLAERLRTPPAICLSVCLSVRLSVTTISLTYITLYTTDANLFTLNFSKTELFLTGQKQLSKNNSSLNTTQSARKLGFIFDEHLTFWDQISALSKSRYCQIRELPCVRLYLDFKTVCHKCTHATVVRTRASLKLRHKSYVEARVTNGWPIQEAQLVPG